MHRTAYRCVAGELLASYRLQTTAVRIVRSHVNARRLNERGSLHCTTVMCQNDSMTDWLDGGYRANKMRDENEAEILAL